MIIIVFWGGVTGDRDAMSIVKNQTINLADYKPHSQNYNKHSDAQLAKLQASLSKFGQVRSIVVWREYIIAGHGLTEAAKRLGWKSLRADVLDSEISESVALAYLVADNELARQSDPDQAALAAILQQVAAADAELVTAAGFSEQELSELLASLEPVGVEEPGEGAYKEQYGVIVICNSATHQEEVYNDLLSGGYQVKVVVT